MAIEECDFVKGVSLGPQGFVDANVFENADGIGGESNVAAHLETFGACLVDGAGDVVLCEVETKSEALKRYISR